MCNCVKVLDYAVGKSGPRITRSAEQRRAAQSSAEQRTAAHSSAQQRTAAHSSANNTYVTDNTYVGEFHLSCEWYRSNNGM